MAVIFVVGLFFYGSYTGWVGIQPFSSILESSQRCVGSFFIAKQGPSPFVRLLHKAETKTDQQA